MNNKNYHDNHNNNNIRYSSSSSSRTNKGTNLFVTLFTVVSIGTFKQVAFHVLLQRLEQILLVPYVDVQHRERLLA